MDVLKEIVKSGKATKVIMITAVGQEQMVKEAMKLGAKDYIVKPFNASKVVQTIKKVLG